MPSFLDDLIASRAPVEGDYAIAYALLRVAEAIERSGPFNQSGEPMVGLLVGLLADRVAETLRNREAKPGDA